MTALYCVRAFCLSYVQELVEAAKANSELKSHVEKAMEQVIAANMQKETFIKKVWLPVFRNAYIASNFFPCLLLGSLCRCIAFGLFYVATEMGSAVSFQQLLAA